MPIPILKKYLLNFCPFAFSITFFIIIIISCLYLLVTWNSPLDAKTLKEKTQIEVSLPIIDINSYNTLSKQIKGDIINRMEEVNSTSEIKTVKRPISIN